MISFKEIVQYVFRCPASEFSRLQEAVYMREVLEDLEAPPVESPRKISAPLLQTKHLKKTSLRTKQEHRGLTGKIWEAIRRSKGNVSSLDLARSLKLAPNRVSAALTFLTNRHPSSLQRKEFRAADPQGGVKRCYLYSYVGKSNKD